MIEKLRERLGITKAEMISRLGITRNYYSMIANGERPISMKLGIKIRDEFGISLDIIFFPSMLTICYYPSKKQSDFLI
ncbi:MAG: helix-turn-helix transcriptional regulator [Desulfosporosinus sp.]|nr:helix-turn-helix transcriptional regulator [Desulfosporosinus sp.]